MSGQSGSTILWLAGINTHQYPSGGWVASFGARRSRRHKEMIDAVMELMKVIGRDLDAYDAMQRAASEAEQTVVQAGEG